MGSNGAGKSTLLKGAAF
ncbi:hypothetical protein M5X11_10345 [Paenibacillus alginolyticus]|nr:hypothetical protein [Paenibacillus alginolyticus]